MAWLWSKPPAPPAQNTAPPIPEAPSHPTPTQQSEPPPISRDEQELQSFLQEISSSKPQPSTTKYTRVSKDAPPEPTTSDRSSLPISEQLLPTTMSCRDAFDAAFYCNSMGGQFTNLYRYGNVRTCSESWNDFWFCMRTRTWSGPEKEEAIRARFREKEKVKYGRRGDEGEGMSSEDIWKSRDGLVQVGEAFSKPFPGFGQNSEEYNRKVREDRRKFFPEDEGNVDKQD